MNLLDGKISTGTEQAASVTIGSDRLELPGHLTAAAAQASGGEAVVGVRPEHLSLASSGGITAKVTVIESLGHERHVVCTTPDGQGITVRIDHDDPVPADDETVHVVWDPDAVHIFDRASGDRLDP